jgi:hypothetical protein
VVDAIAFDPLIAVIPMCSVELEPLSRGDTEQTAGVFFPASRLCQFHDYLGTTIKPYWSEARLTL